MCEANASYIALIELYFCREETLTGHSPFSSVFLKIIFCGVHGDKACLMGQCHDISVFVFFNNSFLLILVVVHLELRISSRVFKKNLSWRYWDNKGPGAR